MSDRTAKQVRRIAGEVFQQLDERYVAQLRQRSLPRDAAETARLKLIILTEFAAEFETRLKEEQNGSQ